MQLLD